MEPIQEVKHSLSQNWDHQREMSDAVVLLKEKVAQLENGKKMQSQFIAGIVTSFILAVFYFGSQSAQVEHNMQTLTEHDTRIRAIGPVINDVAASIETKIDEHIKNH